MSTSVDPGTCRRVRPPPFALFATLKECDPGADAMALTGAGLLTQLIGQRRPNALLFRPKDGSEQRIMRAARRRKLGHRACTRVRSGNRHVAAALPPGNVRGRALVILDETLRAG